jgi:ATP-dependent helicase HrpA
MTAPLSESELKKLRSLIDQAMCADRFRLRRGFDAIQERLRANKPGDEQFSKWRKKLDESLQQVARRKQLVPGITYPEQLPVSQRCQEIADLLSRHQVIILAGETGSGKTTQIPKICLEMGRGIVGMIGHTQPRRLAARSVAARIAEEMQVKPGEQVGYQVRFTDQCSENTLLKLMTDGILLAEIQHDRYLERYDTIIIDEAHERSLNIDFLLGYIKRILPRRPDLKVIVTSATIDLERFSAHFNDAPIIEISGRTYPVEIVYKPSEEWQDDVDQPAAIIDAVQDIIALEARDTRYGRNGDILVFLSGEREIRETALAIRRADLPHCEVLPLYARLSNAEQNRVFDIQGRSGRRIVLATNVAETSLTVPGIHYVIDPGQARISRYSYRTKVQRLPIEGISQASANQRAGRCGRIADGVCIRLYSEQEFLARPVFTDPEIQRTNLASVILQMLNMGLGAISAFPFIDPPDTRIVNDGFKLLEELGAVSEGRKLNSVGRALGKLPVDPRLAKMLLTADKEACLREVLIIASALSVQDPRERPADKQQAADEKHRRFADEKSDFIALLNVWRYYEEQRQALSQNQLRKLCKKEFLSWLRMREWRDVHFQLRLAIKSLGLKENQLDADNRSIHRALLSGLLGHVGFRHDDKEYTGARNRQFKIFPGSFLKKKQPKWLVAAELVETTQLYARMVAYIEPDWLLGIGDHLFKYSYSEPHWQQRRGKVLAFEKISLYGLVISERRKVDYAPIDPVVAREIFIRAALVEGRYNSKAAFFLHNKALLKELDELEAKARRRDIVADEQTLFEFYNERIPADVCSAGMFEKWRRKIERKQADLLKVDRELLIKRDTSQLGELQFPDQIVWNEMRFELRYRFEPGHAEDGVSALIPIGLLNRVPKHLFEWLVPGLLPDKCIALVKALPKQLRKNLVPVPDVVNKALPGMQVSDKPLLAVLAQQIHRLKGLQIDEEQWQESAIDSFYRMNFQVLDAEGKVLGQGRDLSLLIEQFRDRVQQNLVERSDQQFDEVHTEWDFEDLPQVHRFNQAGIEICAYPAVVDKGASVAIELCDYPEDAQLKHCDGLVRLLMLLHSQQVKYLRKELLKGNNMMLWISSLGGREQLLSDAIRAIFRSTFITAGQLPRTRASFEEMVQANKSQLVSCANRYEALLGQIFVLHHAIDRVLKGKVNPLCLQSYADIRAQLDALVYPGFIYATPWEWLQQYPRYLQAVEQRLEKLGGQLQKDRVASMEMASMMEKLQQKIQQDETLLSKEPELLLYRWMLEEYRVSLFAQQLGTRMPVSAKRIARQWQQFVKN